MIISCPNCQSNFNVKDELIPINGRKLKCSKCGHKWFFKYKIEVDKSPEDQNTKIRNPISDEVQNDTIDNEKLDAPDEQLSKTKEENLKKDKKKIPRKSFFKLILIFLISFLSLIILIDTFKGPISKFIPNINDILDSLYQSIVDISLFIKDLIL